MSEIVKVNLKETERINQGDIYRNIEFIEKIEEVDGFLIIQKIVFPLVMVLTQDCDLEQDHNNKCQSEKDQDKYLLSVLAAPIYNASHVFKGEHFSELGYKLQNIKNVSSTKVNLVKNNEIPRYYYLDFVNMVPIPPSIMDFKHYFSVNLEVLLAKHDDYVCTVEPLYREKISHKFSNYLSRIGLPNYPRD